MLRSLRRAQRSGLTRQVGSRWRAQRHVGSAARGGADAEYLDGLRGSSDKIHVVESGSSDPYFNLSLEHHLLGSLPAKAVLLFTYVNEPCVVIGRNQNPWLEVDLKQIGRSRHVLSAELGRAPSIQLVRRRSGGGAVYHDHGNVNWAIICPRDAFTRDKHAEMVTRALRVLKIDRARVNERHDIVLDQGDLLGSEMLPATDDMHRTRYETSNSLVVGPLKVSGSAYKLVKDRALHHATLLLRSSSISTLSGLLTSPAQSYIVAKGVESVRSSVGQVDVDANRLIGAIASQFEELYGKPSIHRLIDQTPSTVAFFRHGLDELRSDAWTYGQTPHFDFEVTEPSGGLKLALSCRSGRISRLEVMDTEGGCSESSTQYERAIGRELWEINSFQDVLLSGAQPSSRNGDEGFAAELERLGALVSLTDSMLIRKRG